MTTGLAHMAITVKDMEASLDFYTRAIGLKKAFDIPRPDSGEPWIVYLYVARGQFVELFYGAQTDNPWSWRVRGFNHVCFAVDDIHAAAKQVTDAGYALTEAPKEGADGNWQCWTMDPDGVRVELMQLSPKSPHAKANEGFARGE